MTDDSNVDPAQVRASLTRAAVASGADTVRIVTVESSIRSGGMGSRGITDLWRFLIRQYVPSARENSTDFAAYLAARGEAMGTGLEPPSPAEIDAATRDPLSCAGCVHRMLEMLMGLPGEVHWALAWRVLSDDGKAEVDRDEQVALGAELAKQVMAMCRRVDDTRDEDDRARLRSIGLKHEIKARIDDLRRPDRMPLICPLDSTEAPRLDAALLEHLERMGAQGKRNASVYRARLTELRAQAPLPGLPDPAIDWRGWLDPTAGSTWSRALWLLTDATWIDVVQPELERRRRILPALALAVMEPTTAIMGKQGHLFGDDRVLDADGRKIGWFELPPEVPATDIEAVRAFYDQAHRGLSRLGQVLGHRTMRHVVVQAHAQVAQGASDPRRVQTPGGLKGLLDALEVSHRQVTELRELLDAGVGFRFANPALRGSGLWTWHEQAGGRYGRGSVTIIAGEPLLPHFVMELPQASRIERVARRLAPEILTDPPMKLLRRNDHGAALTMSRLVIVKMVQCSTDMARGQGVQITRDDWLDMARLAGLPAGVVDRLVESWLKGDDTAPALLRLVGPDRYELADAHRAERDFITAGGQLRLDGEKGGRRRVYLKRTQPGAKGHGR